MKLVWFFTSNFIVKTFLWYFRHGLRRKQYLWLYSLGVYYCVSVFMHFVNFPSLCAAETVLQKASICVGDLGTRSLETYNKKGVYWEVSASVKARQKVMAVLRSGSFLGDWEAATEPCTLCIFIFAASLKSRFKKNSKSLTDVCHATY